MSGKPADSVVLRRTSYSVQPGATNEITSALEEYLQYVRVNERGTQVYLAMQSASKPNEFIHCAEFENELAFNLSQRSAAYFRFVEILRPALIGDVQVHRDDGTKVANAGSWMFGSSDTIVAVKLRVMNRNTLPRFRQLLIAFTHRQANGLMMSDAFVDPQDELVYIIYERWVSQAALTAAMGGELRKRLLEFASLDIMNSVSFG
jgi:quinol monooxygenase YgiN